MERYRKLKKRERSSSTPRQQYFPSGHNISNGRRKTISEKSEATAVPVPDPRSGPTIHSCFQAGHHKVTLSYLDVTEHFGQRISAKNCKNK